MMEQKHIKLDIEFVDHMGYYIPKSEVDNFDPATYFEGPRLNESENCMDEICQMRGYCRLVAKPIN